MSTSFDCYSFCDIQEDEDYKPTVMGRSHSNSSNSTQESISAFISSTASPSTDIIVDGPFCDDNTNDFFDFCDSLEYTPIPDFQDFVCLETMLTQSKKIKKEKVSSTPSPKKQKSSGAKETWKSEEDAQLVALYAEFGPKWAKIASQMNNRTGKQVRDRYNNKLRPDIANHEWTLEEENLLFSLCEQFGNKWCKIASYLPGRTEYQVKNKFYWEKRKQTAISSKAEKAPIQSVPITESFLSDNFKEVQWVPF